MPDTTIEQAIPAMDRLGEVTPAPITCSIGIAQWDVVESADALIYRADLGLYAAKAAGRNQAAVAPDGDSADVGHQASRSAYRRKLG